MSREWLGWLPSATSRHFAWQIGVPQAAIASRLSGAGQFASSEILKFRFREVCACPKPPRAMQKLAGNENTDAGFYGHPRASDYFGGTVVAAQIFCNNARRELIVVNGKLFPATLTDHSTFPEGGVEGVSNSESTIRSFNGSGDLGLNESHRPVAVRQAVSRERLQQIKMYSWWPATRSQTQNGPRADIT